MNTILLILLILFLAGAFGAMNFGALALTPVTILVIILIAVLLGGGGRYWR